MVTKEIQKARVTFDYDPDQEDELKLKVGEIILITDKKIFDGWMQGELNGKSGLFPDNFVQLLPPETVSVPAGDPAASNPIEKARGSVRRDAKASPEKPPEPAVNEKPKMSKVFNLVYYIFILGWDCLFFICLDGYQSMRISM